MTVKPRTNYWLDAAIFALFLVVLVSGLLLWFVYPHGGTRSGQQAHERGGRGTQLSAAVTEPSPDTTILGLTRQDMDSVHDWSGLAMGGLVLLHVVFHWKWIVCQTKRLFGGRNSRKPSRTCPDA